MAHIDATIERLARTLEGYLAKDPLIIRKRFTTTTEEAVFEGAAPVPEAARRLFADALNQMRNVLEHALFAEVQNRLDRPMTKEESQVLEVPATKSTEAFDAWLKHKHRRSLGLLTPGADLYERLVRLQPFQRNDPDAHPLKVLAEHTNYAKHREPAVALIGVGRVDRDSEIRRLPVGHRDKVEPGDVLISVPLGTREGLSIWPEMTIRRPHTGQRETLVKEVRWLEEWVRRQALPILIAGTTELPAIPPELDVSTGYSSVTDAWQKAGAVPAGERMQQRIAAEGLRRDMLEMLAEQFGDGTRARFGAWLASLDVPTVMAKFQPVLAAAGRGDEESWYRAAEAWRAEARVEPPMAG